MATTIVHSQPVWTIVSSQDKLEGFDVYIHFILENVMLWHDMTMILFKDISYFFLI